MRYSELVSYTKEIRIRKADLLVVISSFNGYGLVERHLELLSRQTYQEFNVLLVLGVPFEDAKLVQWLEKRKFPFGVIIAKENERRGCSGGFFTGQKYALEKDYRYVIMADDDCMPVDRELLGELWRNRKALYVVPTTVFVEGSYRKKGFAAGPTQYSLYSTDIFRRYGLYYLPLFHGADDGEYMERVREAPVRLPNRTEHPYISGMRLFSMFDRQWLFLLQALIIMRSWRMTLYNIAQLSFMAAVSLCFLPPYGRRVFANANRLLLTHTYGKKAGDMMRTGFETWITAAKEKDFSGFKKIDEREAGYIDRPGFSKLKSIAEGSLALWRRDVLVENTYSFLRAFFLAIAARRLFVRMGAGKYLCFADNSSPLLHAAKLLLFVPALALQLALCALFLPLKVALQPRTLGYGLD